jgi:hypothetical protein
MLCCLHIAASKQLKKEDRAVLTCLCAHHKVASPVEGPNPLLHLTKQLMQLMHLLQRLVTAA